MPFSPDWEGSSGKKHRKNKLARQGYCKEENLTQEQANMKKQAFPTIEKALFSQGLNTALRRESLGMNPPGNPTGIVEEEDGFGVWWWLLPHGRKWIVQWSAVPILSYIGGTPVYGTDPVGTGGTRSEALNDARFRMNAG